MSVTDRRGFLRTGVAAAASLAAWGRCRKLWADPYGMPIGLQLYTVRNDLRRDFAGTLGKVAAIGYRELELAGPYHESAAEVKRIAESNGMRCVSAHIGYDALKSDLARQIGHAKELGLRYLILPSLPYALRRSRDALKQAIKFMDQTGQQCRKADLYFGYHNHDTDFTPVEGTCAFDQLIGFTNPKLVCFELDCFWATWAGRDPVDLLNQFRGRFPLLHIKDEKPGYPPTTLGRTPPQAFTEVGRGKINWKPILEAAHKGGLLHFFVEQDQSDMPEIRAAQISYEYLHQLSI